MRQFKVVTLDYPKLTIEDNRTKKVLSDMIQGKQIAFAKTDEAYVPLGPLDMISTHVLIYDTTDIFNERLVLAIRNCFEDRSKFHKVQLPVENYINYVTPEIREKFNKFHKEKGVIADCNAWYVDPEYSYSKTKLPLSDIGFFAIVLHAMRRGFDHFVAATNERYKASRWVARVGNYEDGLSFIHPQVPDEHKFFLINKFSDEWLVECMENYGSYIQNMNEIYPCEDISGEKLLSIDQVMNKAFERLGTKNLNTISWSKPRGQQLPAVL